MNTTKRIDIILEVFDAIFSPDAMENVIKKDTGYGIVYYFKDLKLAESPTYAVEFAGHTLDHESSGYMDPELAQRIKKLDIPGVITKQFYEVGLSYEHQDPRMPAGYSLTGYNNSNYVYGMVLACFIDFVKNNGYPALIFFESFDDRTISTYKKLMNYLHRVKNIKYVPVSDGMYILREVILPANAELHVARMKEKIRAEI